MADKSSADTPDTEAGADPGLEAMQPDSGAADSTAAEEPTIDSLTARLDETSEQLSALQDQALRAKAEAENVRRRAARDVENAHKFALEKFAEELLPVLDSLEKTVESAVGSASEGAEGTQAIAQGVELSLKMFADVLQKFGVEAIDPLGEPFDPQHHEAMAMVENPDSEPNSVMEVMQKGYSLNGRLVRAAMVIVTKAAS